MTAPLGWDAGVAIASAPLRPWRGAAWRTHARRYTALDPGGSLLFSGRYHRGRDLFPPDAACPALYLALGPEIRLGEVLRHLTSERLSRLNGYRLSEIILDLTATLDCRDATAFGLPHDALLHDTDYRATQALAAAATARGVEGLLVPSATLLGDNLVVFPTNLRSGSRLEVASARDPRLYVPRF